MNKKRGKRTSFGGSVLEQAISQLQLCGFDDGNRQLLSDRYYLKHHRYTTLYGTPGRMEYWIVSPEFSGRLECKFQNSSGSVDEKLPMIVMTLERSLEFTGTIIVLGGKFWNKGRGAAAVSWLKQESYRLKKSGKTLHVVDFPQFSTFCHNMWGT